MSVFTKLAASIFAPQDAGGTPRGVVNGEAQTWGTELERIIDAAVASGNFLLYETKAALDADLAHDANTAALVVGDSTSNDGLYVKSGASGAGSWSRVGDVPGYSFIRATDAGGSANAIAATTALPINESQLIVLPINLTNTGTPVTVSFNGGGALTIKTAAGNNPAIGGLVGGTVVAGYKDSSTFRMLSDQASTAIQAAAEAAQAAAEAARDAAFAAVPPTQFGTIALAEAVTIPGGVNYVETLNRGTADGGTDTDDVLIRWKREASVPSHGRYFLDDSSAVFSIITRVPDAYKFGATQNLSGGSANIDALRSALSYCHGRGLGVFDWPDGIFRFSGFPGYINDYGLKVGIRGAGKDSTYFYPEYDEVTDTLGLFHWREGRARLSGCTIYKPAGYTGGAAFSLLPIASGNVIGYSRFEDIRVSAEQIDSWKHNFYIDGQYNTGSPFGIRTLSFRDVTVFGCELYNWLTCVTGFSWQGGYIAADTGGGSASGDLLMSGTPTVPNNAHEISIATIEGSLKLQGYNQHMTISAGQFGNIYNDPTDIGNILVIGPCAGTVQDNWPKATCRHINSARGEVTITGEASGITNSFSTVNFGVTFASAPDVIVSVRDTAAYAFTSAETTTGVDVAVNVAGPAVVKWQAIGVLA